MLDKLESVLDIMDIFGGRTHHILGQDNSYPTSNAGETVGLPAKAFPIDDISKKYCSFPQKLGVAIDSSI